MIAPQEVRLIACPITLFRSRVSLASPSWPSRTAVAGKTSGADANRRPNASNPRQSWRELRRPNSCQNRYDRNERRFGLADSGLQSMLLNDGKLCESNIPTESPRRGHSGVRHRPADHHRHASWESGRSADDRGQGNSLQRRIGRRKGGFHRAQLGRTGPSDGTNYLALAGLPTQNVTVTVSDLTNPNTDPTAATALDQLQVSRLHSVFQR